MKYLTGLFLLSLMSCGSGLKEEIDRSTSTGGGNHSTSPAIASGATMILDAETLAGNGTGCWANPISWNDSTTNNNDGNIQCLSTAGNGFQGTGVAADPYRVHMGTEAAGSTWVSTMLDAQPATMPSATWVAWVRPANTNFSHLASIDNHGGAWNRSIFVDNGTLNWGVFVGTTDLTWDTTRTVDTGNWQFIAVTFTPTDVDFFKNGLASTDYPGTPDPAATVNTLKIARSGDGVSDQFTGDIGWIGIYPRALTDQEIADTCNALKDRYAGATCP